MKIPAKSPDEKRVVFDQIPYAWWVRAGTWAFGVWDAIRTVPAKSWSRQRVVGVGEPGFDESMLILVERSSYFPYPPKSRGCSIDRAQLTELTPSEFAGLQPKPTIIEQLISANRVVDLDGKQLDLDWFREQVYLIRRARQHDTGRDVSIMDAVCSDKTAAEFSAAMLREIERKYGPEAAKLNRINEAGCIGHTRFELLEVGVTLAVITPTSFDEFMRQIWRSDLHPGLHLPDAELWLLDFSDINLGGNVDHPERHLVIRGFKGFLK